LNPAPLQQLGERAKHFIIAKENPFRELELFSQFNFPLDIPPGKLRFHQSDEFSQVKLAKFQRVVEGLP
jgi:hypothetical protein